MYLENRQFMPQLADLEKQGVLIKESDFTGRYL